MNTSGDGNSEMTKYYAQQQYVEFTAALEIPDVVAYLHAYSSILVAILSILVAIYGITRKKCDNVNNARGKEDIVLNFQLSELQSRIEDSSVKINELSSVVKDLNSQVHFAEEENKGLCNQINGKISEAREQLKYLNEVQFERDTATHQLEVHLLNQNDHNQAILTLNTEISKLSQDHIALRNHYELKLLEMEKSFEDQKLLTVSNYQNELKSIGIKSQGLIDQLTDDFARSQNQDKELIDRYVKELKVLSENIDLYQAENAKQLTILKACSQVFHSWKSDSLHIKSDLMQYHKAVTVSFDNLLESTRQQQTEARISRISSAVDFNAEKPFIRRRNSEPSSHVKVPNSPHSPRKALSIDFHNDLHPTPPSHSSRRPSTTTLHSSLAVNAYPSLHKCRSASRQTSDRAIPHEHLFLSSPLSRLSFSRNMSDPQDGNLLPRLSSTSSSENLGDIPTGLQDEIDSDSQTENMDTESTNSQDPDYSASPSISIESPAGTLAFPQESAFPVHVSTALPDRTQQERDNLRVQLRNLRIAYERPLKEFTLLSEMYAKRISDMHGLKAPNPNLSAKTSSESDAPAIDAHFRASESSILQFKEELDLLLENVSVNGPTERFVPKTPIRVSRSNSRASSNSMVSSSSMVSFASSSYTGTLSPHVLRSPISLLYAPGNPFFPLKREGINQINPDPRMASQKHRRAQTGISDSYFEARQLNLSSEFSRKPK